VSGPPRDLAERTAADLPPSRDYWDLVFQQLGRRKLFKAALALLTLLYGAAIAAPLLVNDKPYRIECVDLAAHDAHVRTLRITANELARYGGLSDDAYARSIAGKGAAAPSRGAAFVLEADALRRRLAALRPSLPAQYGARLDEVSARLAEAEAAFGVDAAFQRGVAAAGLLDARQASRPEAVPPWPGPRDAAAAAAAFAALKDLCAALRKELTAYDPSKPDAPGIDLVGVRSYPLLESLRPLEVGLLWLWLALATWPLWNRLVNRSLLRGKPERIRRVRRIKCAVVLLSACAVGAGWRAAFGAGRTGLDSAPHKLGLTNGAVRLVAAGRTLREAAAEPAAVGSVVFAPIPFGYTETGAVGFRPPTWRAESALDPESGRYVHASRKDADAQSGVTRAVQVRAGEPPLNAPHRHLAGTDEVGRDLFGRLIWGSRVSLSVGVVSALLLTVIGTFFGALAGYFGGWVDLAVMRAIEVLQSIPSFFLILLAMAFTNPDVLPPVFAIVLVIGFVGWTGVARLVRGEFLRLREQEFVLAARALGFSDARIIVRHVLPNAMSPVLVAAAFSVASGILIESAVSFLGFGVRQPEASWGSLVNASRSAAHWWIQVFPGLLIFVTVTCYNLVGDAVRDALDPRLKL